MEFEQHKNHVIEKWTDQKEEKEMVCFLYWAYLEFSEYFECADDSEWFVILLQAHEEEMRRKKEFEERLESERLAGLERDRELEQRRLENELKLRDILKQQMSELQSKEKEVCVKYS